MLVVHVEPHPALAARAFLTTFPVRLADMPSADWLVALFSPDTPAKVRGDDTTRVAVRDLLRHGGFKPTGRSKPASEYLVRAAREGALRSINVAVDACNAVSLHSALPISVVDVDRLECANTPGGRTLRVGVASPGTMYVFNPSGQTIDVSGLICLSDGLGPCASPVKDAQRTKTSAETRRTLSIVWGYRAAASLCQEATAWYREMLGQLGAQTESIDLTERV